jgi:hypothetical protein
MQRYLIFEPSSAKRASEVLGLCNVRGPWINEVLELSDSRVPVWATSAGVLKISSPALIRVNGTKVHVLQRDMLRIRMQQVLGPHDAQVLWSALMGDKELEASENIIESTNAYGTSTSPARPKVPKPLGRRQFLGLGK